MSRRDNARVARLHLDWVRQDYEVLDANSTGFGRLESSSPVFVFNFGVPKILLGGCEAIPCRSSIGNDAD